MCSEINFVVEIEAKITAVTKTVFDESKIIYRNGITRYSLRIKNNNGGTIKAINIDTLSKIGIVDMSPK